MKKKNEPGKIPFIKYHPCTSCLFTPAESRFILHMADMEARKENGFYTGWSKAEYMKIMGLNGYTFDKCVDKLLSMKLLSRRYNSRGNRVYYSFDLELYGKIVQMLSLSRDIDKVSAFCRMFMEEKGGCPDKVTKEELEELASGDNVKIAFVYR